MTDIRESTRQIIAHLRSDRGGGTEKWPSPAPESIVAFRKSLDLTREEFADCFGLQLGTLRDWEQGRRKPDQAASLLLKLIEQHPHEMAKAVDEVRNLEKQLS